MVFSEELLDVVVVGNVGLDGDHVAAASALPNQLPECQQGTLNRAYPSSILLRRRKNMNRREMLATT